MIFLMAAIVALMLYQQLPRVAFETERDKEQLLIDRGEQYIRAIQLYYVANNRQYPTSIDDLEKKEKRFLRRRYLDPYTGKDEWRIIHTNGGFLTDSLVQKPPATGDSQSQSASSTPSPTPPTNAPPQVNAAVLQRPSDRPVTPQGGFGQPFPTQQDPNAQANAPLPPITLQTQQQGQGALPPISLQPQQGAGALPPITLQPGGNQPGGLPPITLGTTANGQNPGQIPGQPGQLRAPQGISGQGNPGQGTVAPYPGQTGPGGLPGGIQTGIPPGFRIDTNGQLVPIAPAAGQGVAGQTQTVPAQPQGFPGQPFVPQPGQPVNQLVNQAVNQPLNQPVNQPGGDQGAPGGAPNGAPNGALNLINQLLTSPRQTVTTPVTSGNQVGAIAGIASTHTGPSIKTYKDQTQYQLWEFVFSPTNSTVPGGGAPSATPGVVPGGGTPPPGGTPYGTPSGTSQSPFGNSFGTAH
jgi:hypothetical protein